MVHSVAAGHHTAGGRGGRKACIARALCSAAFAIGLAPVQQAVAGEAMAERQALAPTSILTVRDDPPRLSLFLDDDETRGQPTDRPTTREDVSDHPAEKQTVRPSEVDENSLPSGSLDLEVIGYQSSSIQAGSEIGPDVVDADSGVAEAQPTGDGDDRDATRVYEAQFQLPKPSPEGEAPTQQLPTRLVYQYGYGSESELTYRQDRDLNRHVQDDSLIATPELNAHVIYRPTDWLETTLEMIINREFPLKETRFVTLPDGDVQVAENRQVSLLVDQAFVRVKNVTDPFELTLGRLNFEDERHWLYDTSLDIGQVRLKQGKFTFDFSVGREELVNGDLLQHTRTDRIDTYMFYADYRGIEDIKIGAYSILRDDRNKTEGQPWLFGVRSQGLLSDDLSYWIELAHMRGSDEMSRNFRAYAFDVGATYRFPTLPFSPNVTVGFAYASGDDDPNDKTNHEFRQSGLQSNETKFAGVSEFKIYGEALDPELSNLRVLTAGLGFRPAPNVSLDFVFHKYRLSERADEIRNSEITAQMNQDDEHLSKDVGSAFDIVLGFRSLFGIRRLGIDLRTGWFFPGDAFRIEQPDESFRDANKGFAVVTKFWW